MSRDDDLYAMFGVARDVDARTLKKAWLKLARALHPDRNPDDPGSSERLAAVNAAYAVLSDPERRRQYDQYGVDATSAFFDESLLRPGDQMGARGAEGASRTPPKPRPVERGTDLEVELRLSFSEAKNGGVHEVTVIPDRPCPKCEGTGWRVGGRACSSCEGGVIPGIGPVRVQVPPGMRDGQVLAVAGGGRAGRGKGADHGDLHIRVRVPPVYARFSDGVHVEVPCPRDVLDDGGVVEVPLQLGGAVKVRVKPGTEVGQKLRLRGKGGPGADLIATLIDGDPEPIPVQSVSVKLD